MSFPKSSAVACSRLFLGWVLASVALASTVVACSAEDGSAGAANDAGKKQSSSRSNKDDDDSPSKKKKKADAGADASDGGEAPDGDAGGSGDASSDARAVDSSAPVCAAIGLGDLQIVEVMVASRAGQDDDGEWIEIKNVRSCTVNLKGVRISSPRGSLPENAVTVTTDVLVPPGGRFIVADSAVASVNGNLPGTVIPLQGTPSDVFANDSDEIYVEVGTTLIEAFEYNLTGGTPGHSVMFPETCPANTRGEATRWRLSLNSWTAGRYGTPNAPNNDVACN